MLLYYITDRHQFEGSDSAQWASVLAKIAEAAHAGVDYIQLRERDLSPRQLESLARAAVVSVREGNATRSIGEATHRTRLLINSRIDIALAVSADGVHLRSDDIAASEARVIWEKATRAGNAPTREFTAAVSCHTPAEVHLAEAHGADFAVFAPVFEKVTAPLRPGAGIPILREACSGLGQAPNVEGVGAGRMPVLALGGVTLENARACLDAGASGIAAIRLFQDHDIHETVARLRALAAGRRAKPEKPS